MTVEQFESLMAGVESLITSLALLIAGGWALYTFRALGQIARSREEIAQLDLQRRKTESEIRKLEQAASVGSVIEMSIKASPHRLPSDSAHYISAIVDVQNKGLSTTRLTYDEDRRPFLIFSVDFNDDGSPEFKKLAAYSVPVGRSPNEASPSLIVRAGGHERLPFLFRVKSAGLYLLVFSASPSEEDQAQARELGFKYPSRWVAKEYLVVE